MLKNDSLRRCHICGLEAFTKEDLEKFVKAKTRPYGRRTLCKQCLSLTRSKKRLQFLNKRIHLKRNPRTNICSECGLKYPEELNRQTDMHHDFYDSSSPLEYTRELCISCHSKIHSPHTDETKRKISESLKSHFKTNLPWNKGKPHSEETKRKISLSKKGKHTSLKTEFKKGHVPWNKKEPLSWGLTVEQEAS